MYSSYVVLLTNLSFIVLFLMLFIESSLLLIFIGFYVIKFIVDLLLLYPTLQFLNRRYLIKWGEKVISNSRINNNQLDLSQLNNGVYFINISTKKGVITKKIIVSK